jgi:hypothetical protein
MVFNFQLLVVSLLFSENQRPFLTTVDCQLMTWAGFGAAQVVSG